MRRQLTVLPIVPVVIALTLQAQQPQFRTTTSLVRLEVSVADDSGPVQGLRAEDFLVEDLGIRQQIRVEGLADAPLDLVLVAQPLASVAYIGGDQAPRVAGGLSAFIAQIQDGDRLAAVVASAPPARLTALRSGRPVFGVDAFAGGVYGAPFDAIAAALLEFDDSSTRSRALVAFTNAADFRSTIRFDVLARLARRLGPAFVLIGTPVKIAEEVNARASLGGRQIGDAATATITGHVLPARLQHLARVTGGTTVNLGERDPEALMAELFEWLRTRYVISYQPPPGQGWHPVTVRVNRRGARVTARDGYLVD